MSPNPIEHIHLLDIERIFTRGMLQEFFSARDEPDPEITQVPGDQAKSPHPKYAFAFSILNEPLETLHTELVVSHSSCALFPPPFPCLSCLRNGNRRR
jgi:hypothetical protein